MISSLTNHVKEPFQCWLKIKILSGKFSSNIGRIVPAFLGNNSKYYDLENASFLTHNNCLLRPILIGLQTYFGQKLCCPSFSYNINLLFQTF